MLEVTDDDWHEVRALVERKYGTWAWNFGEDPPSNVQRAHRFPVGEIDARIDVQGGRIAGIRIFGDFMGREDVRALEARLTGLPYAREPIAAALAGVAIADYFGDVSAADVVELIAP
jgi:lipoate-protein ligase A